MLQFNFGKNWQTYSTHALDRAKFEEAKQSVTQLIGRENIINKNFLDIGSGSGIFSLAIRQLGAQTAVGIDISLESVCVAQSNAEKFGITDVVFNKLSIFDESVKQLGKFDVVYSWGVLHHTGNMYQAIKISMDLVADQGLFVLAIYNKHWSSWLWKIIKYSYNKMSGFLQKMYVYIFSIIIFIAKFMVTGKNPLLKKRGMNFYYDVIDWIGGYPYEYATEAEIIDFFEKNNFALIKSIKADVPTGCNEFVFKKTV